jgi:hypothetical protein
MNPYLPVRPAPEVREHVFEIPGADELARIARRGMLDTEHELEMARREMGLGEEDSWRS